MRRRERSPGVKAIRLRLLVAFTVLLALPVAIALIVIRAPLSQEIAFGIAAMIPGFALALVASHAVAQAERSHDEVRSSVARLGEALRSTHDLGGLLSITVRSAMAATGGTTGVAYLLSATRDELTVVAAGGASAPEARLRMPVGVGVAGWVAANREPVLIAEGSRAGSVAPEPAALTAVAVPIETSSRLLGVLAVYGCEGKPFGLGELETLATLAKQAGVGLENILLHEEAQRLSITDGLTGIWNRRYFTMRFSQEMQRAARFRRPLSVLMMDIDHFKRVNDRLGHQRGDATLIELTRRTIEQLRGEVDTLARYGGEEFALLLPETGPEGAKVVAEKIRLEVAGRPFTDGDPPATVTVSIGCASYPADGMTPAALLHAADQALYEAKERGRNAVVSAGEIDVVSLARDPARP